jgi:hypothetical protein
VTARAVRGGLSPEIEAEVDAMEAAERVIEAMEACAYAAASREGTTTWAWT